MAPSVAAVIFYCLACYTLILPINTIPVGVIYAIWSGTGIFKSRSASTSVAAPCPISPR
ncbi:TPA: hypothetical protein I3789_004641 [Enterobacter cloacae]|nr:hypothetical protein [Enterobacter cloacae]HAS1098061.1 hypothetical protein [Enterobacter cloacae]